jgi:pimeloyl-ACP methyl ester carboxylesterase
MNTETIVALDRGMAGQGTGIAIEERQVRVWGDRVTLRVKVLGEGKDAVYLHPAAGLVIDDFLLELARTHRIHAIEFPGTSAEDPYAVRQFDDLHDLVLAYEEAIRQLGLERPIAIGQSFGGMLTAELASTFPALFKAVVLLDPIGLWRDDIPVVNWNSVPAEQMPALLFADPESEAAREFLAMPTEPEAFVKTLAARVWTLGCTGAFVWPIPDRGLRKRLHRIKVPTKIIWGRDDKLVSSAYAAEFQRRIPGSEVSIVDDCGHIPQVEKRAETHEIVTQFFARVA